jgi:signal transduction histidine kinase
MKVLIVDDRTDNQLLLREQLRPMGVDAVTADSGVRAVREMKTQVFDLVITDLLMPEMDGFQLCYLLKTDPTLKRTPVIIYTANYATKRDEDQAKSLGADDFLTRPMDDEQLASHIETVMDRARAGKVAEPSTKPADGFFREYSTLLIEKLEDQLITAEENARLQVKNAELHRALQERNADLKKANDELVAANQELETFSYSVSHDLRTPVRAIQGLMSILVEQLGPTLTPSAREIVDRINGNAERMTAMINGLLAHSRMRHAADAVGPVDLNTVMASAITGLDYAIKEAHATVRAAGPFPRVLAHEQSLMQIVSNLIDNALKFVTPGVAPEIHISASVEAGRVRLSVRDNGIGVAPEFQHRLFHIFERLNPGAVYPGTGIGLAIVRKGVERMGGKVGIVSAKGKGSTFWIELPIAP